MKAVEIGSSPIIDQVDDVIQIAQALQEQLAQIPEKHQAETAAQGIEMLGDPRQLYGSQSIAVHSLAAFVFRDACNPCSVDEELYHGARFGDVTMTGHFSRLAYIRHPLVCSLTLMMFDTKIERTDNPVYQGETIISGMHVPVMAVERVIALK